MGEKSESKTLITKRNRRTKAKSRWQKETGKMGEKSESKTQITTRNRRAKVKSRWRSQRQRCYRLRATAAPFEEKYWWSYLHNIMSHHIFTKLYHTIFTIYHKIISSDIHNTSQHIHIIFCQGEGKGGPSHILGGQASTKSLSLNSILVVSLKNEIIFISIDNSTNPNHSRYIDEGLTSW